MLDENFQVYHKNKSALNILNGNIPISFKDDCLSCLNPRIKKNIQEQINKRSNVAFTISYKGIDFHLLVFPLTNPSSYNLTTTSCSIMFVFDTIKDSERIEEVVRTIYKLSPTEAKVASILVYNPYLTDVCSSLGITYNTAKTHLKHIYQKTGTNKLSALIQMIVTGPAGLLIHSTD